MSTHYNVYANSGSNDPVDYSTPVATTASLTYDIGPMAQPSDWTFAVRAFDTGSTFEEQNVDARVRIIVSAGGTDLRSIPNAPIGLGTIPGPSSSVTVTWGYSPLNQGSPPTGFHVYLGTPTPNYASPVATVPYATAKFSYSAVVSGLTGGVTYQASVRAYNATGEETNTLISTFTAATTGPKPVINLVADVV